MDRWKTTLVLLVAVLGGVLIGAHALPSHPAEAQTPSFSECFFGHQETVDINDSGNFSRPAQNRRINIPRGWTVVSNGAAGSGAGNRPRVGVIMLCR